MSNIDTLGTTDPLNQVQDSPETHLDGGSPPEAARSSFDLREPSLDLPEAFRQEFREMRHTQLILLRQVEDLRELFHGISDKHVSTKKTEKQIAENLVRTVAEYWNQHTLPYKYHWFMRANAKKLGRGNAAILLQKLINDHSLGLIRTWSNAMLLFPGDVFQKFDRAAIELIKEHGQGRISALRLRTLASALSSPEAYRTLDSKPKAGPRGGEEEFQRELKALQKEAGIDDPGHVQVSEEPEPTVQEANAEVVEGPSINYVAPVIMDNPFLEDDALAEALGGEEL